MSCQASNAIYMESSLIKLPFPPVIKASDIVDRRNPSKLKSKSPNAFIIYRKAFLDHLSHIDNYNLKMTDVSKLVSKYWNNEPENVKNEYRRIAREVEMELNEKREKAITYKVVWKNSKNSKYYSRNLKRNQFRTQKNKTRSNA